MPQCILLVEDDDNDAILTTEMLNLHLGHFDVIRSGTLRDAVKQIEEHDPQFLILDLGLPDLSGIEVLQQITEVAPGLPVLVLTGWDQAVASRLLSHGARMFVNKKDLTFQTSEKIFDEFLSKTRGADVKDKPIGPAEEAVHLLSEASDRIKSLDWSGKEPQLEKVTSTIRSLMNDLDV